GNGGPFWTRPRCTATLCFCGAWSGQRFARRSRATRCSRQRLTLARHVDNIHVAVVGAVPAIILGHASGTPARILGYASSKPDRPSPNCPHGPFSSDRAEPGSPSRRSPT